MEQSERTRRRLIAHYQKYPLLQIQDILKFLYQSSFGCEHLASSPEKTVAYICKEWDGHHGDGQMRIDALDGDYSRVYLSCLNDGLSAKTLGKLFLASAKPEPDGMVEMEKKLHVAEELVEENLLPFSPEEFARAVRDWKGEGSKAMHHSDVFRANYQPAYRVIANRFVTFLPLFAKIDELLQKEPLVVAIEGGSASGKTTLSASLQEIYDCTVFHMDDFFLRPEQRTTERYLEVGGNIDRERFLQEVLIPLREMRPIHYRRFDCSTFKLEPAVSIIPKKLIIVEGVYSMHPEFTDFYDLTVFLDISPELQKQRIALRNSPKMAERYHKEWIPMENTYFSGMQVKARSDLSIQILE